MQAGQQDGLVIGGLRHATPTYLSPLTRRQHHVHQLNLAQLLEDSPRLVAQSSPLASLRERLPENVGQEADQDVYQHPLLFLVPYRTELQVALVDSERGLGLGQLDIGFPKLLVAPLHNIAA